MSASTPFALLANASSLPWAEIPEWPTAEAFVRATAAELTRGARLCAWFGVPEGDAGARWSERPQDGQGVR